MADLKMFLSSAEEIKAFRKKLGVNQGVFWARVAVTQSGGSRFESGRTIPKTIQMLLHMAYAPEIRAQRLVKHSCAQHVAQIMVRHRQCPSSSEIPELLSPPAFDWDARPFPLVSIIIPTRDQQTRLQRCIESVFAQTPSIPFELILVQHEGEDPAARAFVEGLPPIAPDKIQVLNTSGEFNFARLINLGTARAKGEFLLLLNNDTAALHPEWLENMLVEMADDSVGIVGPRLVFPDGRIQHAGAVLGLNRAADFPWIGGDMGDPGYLGLLQHAREQFARIMTPYRLLFRNQTTYIQNYAKTKKTES